MVLLGISIGFLTFHSFTSGGSEPDVFFDKRAGVSLNASINARLNESQAQTASPAKNEKP
jgi:hypothetical protein